MLDELRKTFEAADAALRHRNRAGPFAGGFIVSDQPLLDYLERTTPFARAGAAPWRCPDHPDWTAQEEASVARYLADPVILNHPIALPVWQAKDAALRRWRERQRAGDTTPRVQEWGEWLLELPDGTKVAVVWDPLWFHATPGEGVHVEFHGEISKTGYLSSFPTDWPEQDEHLLDWLIESAKGIRAAIILEWEKENRPKRKAARRKRSKT